MALIHVLLVRPYVSTIHNIFNLMRILHLIIIIFTLTKVDLINDYDETFFLVITYSLVIMPLTSFIMIKSWVIKNTSGGFRRGA